MSPSLPPPLLDIWVYLSGSPLLWLTVTVVAYVIADWISAKSGRNPLVNPVVIAIALVGGLLVATGTGYRTYFDGAQFVHFLLGPATVALAIPLVRHFGTVRRMLLPMLAAPPWEFAPGRRAASRSGSPPTASARRARFRSTR
jgi:hypothetical protein